jgi:hypothetical protein
MAITKLKNAICNTSGQIVSTDFFTVPTITMKVLFVLIVLERDRRKVLHFNVTVTDVKYFFHP